MARPLRHTYIVVHNCVRSSSNGQAVRSGDSGGQGRYLSNTVSQTGMTESRNTITAVAGDDTGFSRNYGHTHHSDYL
jgi:hypothetical protein